MMNWQEQILTVLPDFNIGRCHWLRGLETEDDPNGPCLRVVVDYAGRYDIHIVLKNVCELPLIRPSTVPGVLPFTPYDLGELLIHETEGRVIVADELKGWKIVAQSLSFDVVEQNATEEE